jgi:hypothetical protein
LQKHYTHEMLIDFLTSPHLSKALNNGSKIKERIKRYSTIQTRPTRPSTTYIFGLCIKFRPNYVQK